MVLDRSSVVEPSRIGSILSKTCFSLVRYCGVPRLRRLPRRSEIFRPESATAVPLSQARVIALFDEKNKILISSTEGSLTEELPNIVRIPFLLLVFCNTLRYKPVRTTHARHDGVCIRASNLRRRSRNKVRKCTSKHLFTVHVSRKTTLCISEPSLQFQRGSRNKSHLSAIIITSLMFTLTAKRLLYSRTERYLLQREVKVTPLLEEAQFKVAPYVHRKGQANNPKTNSPKPHIRTPFPNRQGGSY